MKFAFVCTMFALFAVQTLAASSGSLPYCSLSPPYKYGKGSSVMPWVKAPVVAPFYTLRSGDTLNDPTTYTPDVWNTIHIRTLDIDRKYIGQLLFITNSNGTKVGTWSIPTGTPFQAACGGTSVTHSDADLKSMHTYFYYKVPVGTGRISFNLLIKQGEQGTGEFFYPATGQIGLNLTEKAATSMLGTAPTVLGQPGQSCTEVCALTQTTSGFTFCNAAATKALIQSNFLATAVNSGLVPCKFPLIQGCSSQAPYMDLDGFCWYKENTASNCMTPAINNSVVAPVSTLPKGFSYGAFSCSDKTSLGVKVQRICVCSKSASTANNLHESLLSSPSSSSSSSSSIDQSIADIIDFANAMTSAAQSSSQPQSMMFVLLAFIASVFLIDLDLTSITKIFSRKRNGFGVSYIFPFVCICVCLISFAHGPTLVSAHNWIQQSGHRATVASVAKPCQNRIGNQPHIQVAANQMYQIGWSTGHGDSNSKTHYFVGLHSSDYDTLTFVNSTILDQYISEAPNSAILSGPTWTKQHNHAIDTTNPTYYNTSWFSKMYTTGDPEMIVRDPVMITKSVFSRTAAQTGTYKFLPAAVAGDIRVSYVSTKYPWIESVHKFMTGFTDSTPFSGQSSIANFKTEARKGPGDYIMYWQWAGYRDCIDINVQPKTVTNRYGKSISSGNSTFIRVDHAEISNIQNPATECRKVDPITRSANQCLQDCLKLGSGSCRYVQATRYKNVVNTMNYSPKYSGFMGPATYTGYPVNIPFTQYNSSQVIPNTFPFQVSGPCGYRTVKQRIAAGCTIMNTKCNATALNLQDSDYVCFGVVPFRDQDFQVVEDFERTSDPVDPKFYSTIFIRQDDGGFLNIPAINQTTVPDWAATDTCVTCESINNVLKQNFTYVPNWSSSLSVNGVCRKCDGVTGGAASALSSSNGAASPTPDTDLSSVSGGTLAGIIVGVVVGGLILISIGAYVYKKRQIAARNLPMDSKYRENKENLDVKYGENNENNSSYNPAPAHVQMQPSPVYAQSAIINPSYNVASVAARPIQTTMYAQPQVVTTSSPVYVANTNVIPIASLSPNALSQGWSAQKDDMGRTYYWNGVTGQSTWDMPQ